MSGHTFRVVSQREVITHEELTIGDITISKNIIFSLILLLLTFSELLAITVPTLGVISHSILGIMLGILAAAFSRDSHSSKLLIAILPIPLVRIVSISAPLIQFTMMEWFLVMASLLFSAIVICIAIIGDPIEEYGFLLPRKSVIPLEMFVIGSGLILGYIEFQILNVDAISLDTSPLGLLAPLAALYLGTGLLEELLFRGIIQKHAIDALGTVFGIGLTTLIFMIMHTGWQSFPDIIFVGIVGACFSIVVLHTRSLLGVSISHALVNLSLFIIAPVHFAA